MNIKIIQLFIIALLLCSFTSYAQKKDAAKTGEYEIEADYEPEKTATSPTKTESPSVINPTSFEGKFIENENFVQLEWKIKNKSGTFYIEHSIDDEYYTEIGFTEAVGFETDHYIFEAREFEAGINFYRIKQKINGKTIYSDTKAVSVSKKDDIHVLKLRDEGDSKKIQLRVRERQQVVIQLYDNQGNLKKELFNQVMDVNEIIFRTISKDDYEAGIYFILIKGENFKQSKKIELP